MPPTDNEPRDDLPGDDLLAETRSCMDLQQQVVELLVPCLTVIAHPDPRRVGERAGLTALVSGSSEELSRLEPRFAPVGGGEARPLEDPFVSRKPVLLTAGADGAVVVDASQLKSGVLLNQEPVSSPTACSPEELTQGVLIQLANRVVLVLRLTELTTTAPPCAALIGESAGILRIRQEIQRVADLDFPVLLRGESGTGKELVARAIHDAGPRRDQPYRAVNIGAIPGSIAAAELFGATKGAYSGADKSREGYFQQAAGGTIFLDEIGEAPEEVQVLLLRTLDTGQIQPVGAAKTVTANARVISATDANLEAAAADGGFRSPLLHRLSSYEITLPPLRDRRDDFGRLFYHFLEQEFAALSEPNPVGKDKDHPWVPADLVARLAAFHWPGNVRQLRNVVRQLVVGSRGEPQMRLVDKVQKLLDDGSGAPAANDASASTAATPKSDSKQYRQPYEISTEELLAALRAEGWNLNRTATRLDISRTTLYKLIDECPDIRKASDLTADEIKACREKFAGDLAAMADHLQVSPRGLQLRIKKLRL
ncbi:MAG: sigma-54 dependent transcriptional regulator [bacterium]